MRPLKKFLKSNARPIYNLAFNLRELTAGRKMVDFGDFTVDDIAKFCGTKSPIIIDIGTNDGTEIYAFLKAYPDTVVYAIEADPIPYRRLVDRFKEDQRVQCYNLAIAEYDGEITFNCSSGYFHDYQRTSGLQHDYSGSILKPKLHLEYAPDVTFEKQINIKCMTLDNFIASHHLQSPDFIWMDVQGAEFNVLKGGEKILREARGIYTEYSFDEMYEGQKDLWFIANHLKKFDYELKRRYEFDALFVR